jgi:tetratricopeptide (TPR) repeat protein
LAYGLIFILYLINKPAAQRTKEPMVALYDVLNHSLLQAEDYGYLLKMENSRITPNKDVLNEFKDYFQLVIDSFPNQYDAYSMMGYCQYYLGHEDEAIKDYTSSIQANPTFFCNYFNLAVIYFNKGEFSQSADLIRQSLSLPLQLTGLSLVTSNSIYMLIIQQLPGQYPENVDLYLDNEKQKAVELLRLSNERLNGPANPSTQRFFLQLI